MKTTRCPHCGTRRVTYRIHGGRGGRAIRAHHAPGQPANTECPGSRLPVHPHALTDI